MQGAAVIHAPRRAGMGMLCSSGRLGCGAGPAHSLGVSRGEFSPLTPAEEPAAGGPLASVHGEA